MRNVSTTRSRKWVAGIVGGIAVLALIGNLAGCGENESSGNGQSKAASTSKVKATKAKAKHKAAAKSPTKAKAKQAATQEKKAPKPKPKIKPQVVRGNGDDVVDVKHPSKASTMEFNCPHCSGNTAVTSDGPEYLLVNEIGSYHGTRPISLADNGQTSRITVKTNGSWTMTLRPLESLKPQSGKTSGHGDDVVLMKSHADRAKITNQHGDSNFAVTNTGMHNGMQDLLVNEIGGYSGTVSVDLPGLIEVQSNGDWTITPK